MRKKEKGYKPAPQPRKVKEPTIDSNFIMFFINLMSIKQVIYKYGYGRYWNKWSFDRLSDIALRLFVKGYTIG